MFTIAEVTSMTIRLQQVHKPTGANVHTYTNKVASAVGAVQIYDMYIARGKDTTTIVNKIPLIMMDMYRWVDRQYNKHLYEKAND